MIESTEQKIIEAAIRSRRSIRAFKPTPVAREDIEAILDVSARAPSGSNTQPWKVYVLTGETRQRLSQRILDAYLDPAQSSAHTEEYAYYPRQWVAPYIDRRRKVGWDLYGLLGLTRDDKAGMQAQHGRNYVFFDAPVGLIFTIDRVMEQGSWLDYGMFLQSIMVAARGYGLHTCAQAALANYPDIVKAELGIPDSEVIVCGISMGYEDPAEKANSFRATRLPIDEFMQFHT